MSTIKNIDLQINVINNRLARLPKHLKKAKKSGQSAAAKSMIKEIKNHVPVNTKGYGDQSKWKRKKKAGNLRRSVGRITGLRRSKNTFIGMRAGRKYSYDGWYARLVEFGNYGKSGTPFWRKAVTSALPIGKSILTQAAKAGFKGFKIENTK